MSYQFIIEFIRELYSKPEGIIPLHEPIFIGNEKKYILDAIDSTFVSSVGEYVNKFEELMCNVTGAKYAVATVNGTSALHIALLLANVKKEDEVLTQSLSFVATANAISYCGAIPVFLDVDKKNLGLSHLALKSFFEDFTTLDSNGVCINKQTKRRIAACVPMHTFGLPCKIDEIVEICNQYKVPVIEDAAESLGSRYKGKQTGTFGLLGAYSFNGNKIVTSGGGGCIVTDNKEIATKAKHLSTTAKVSHPWEYVHDEIGFNYRLTNLSAALACAQLEQLFDFIKYKALIHQKYESFFSTVEDINLICAPMDSEINYWLNAIILSDPEEREKFLTETNNAGIQTRPIWRLIHKLTMYSSCQSINLTNSDWLEERVVNIPSSVNYNIL